MAVIFKTSALASAPTAAVQGGERKTRRKTRPRAERDPGALRSFKIDRQQTVNTGDVDLVEVS
jgi:hypothetical protein